MTEARMCIYYYECIATSRITCASEKQCKTEEEIMELRDWCPCPCHSDDQDLDIEPAGGPW